MVDAQAPFEITHGLEQLKKIISEFPSESPFWSEAQNRFQFIDRLLTECLGWERPLISVEIFDELGGRADYLLGSPVRAVLEAKKEAKIYESVPTGRPTSVRKLKTVMAASRNFSESVTQVLPYCMMHGAQIAIVCNGPQLAIFQAMTPGMSPLDGECFFFNGFQMYIDEFVLLWSLLSPEGITENRAYRDLSLHRNPRIPPKGSDFILEPNRFRYRSDFQENLRGLSSLLLEEIEDNPGLKRAFYRDCYVRLSANNRHLLLSKSIILARYQRAGGDGLVPTPLNDIRSSSVASVSAIGGSAFTGGVGSRPVLVLGDVGVGKTSFFENLYQSLSEEEQAETYFIHINLGLHANLSNNLKGYVLNEIPAALKSLYDIDINSDEFVKAIYYRKLEDFDLSVEGRLKEIDETAYKLARIRFLSDLVAQRDRHLEASLGHLSRGRGKRIILIMDNADQRTFDIQQEAFLIAQELAATRNLLVFIALRPSTFFHSKTVGALSGYQNKIFTISPPPADEVVEKRLTFALNVAEGKVEHAGLEHIRLQLGSIAAFLKSMLRSIKANEDIRLFLSNITGGNTRAVIELVTGFCGSPNVDSKKIVDIEIRSGNYSVPLHEFQKHALLGDYAYFNSQSSPVAFNLFDVVSPDPREHFLASLVVAFLNSNMGTKDNDGFINGAKILQEMNTHGFLEDQTRSSLRRLARRKLIETPHGHYRELLVAENDPPEQFYYRATSVGLYHIRFWAGSFAFLDATSTDTPIFDVNAREKVIHLASSFEISDRYSKTETFKGYLESQWNLANIGSSYFDFREVLKLHIQGFEVVKSVASRLPKPRSSYRLI